MQRLFRYRSVAHKSEECVLPGDDDPDVGKRLKTIETAVVALTQPIRAYSETRRPRSAEISTGRVELC